MNELVTQPASAAVLRGTSALAQAETPSILNNGPMQIPVAGKIRPGIKVLTPSYSKNEDAVSIYESGMHEGLPYSQIDRAVIDACGQLGRGKSCLMPKNVPYFTVRPEDFPTPETAKRIMHLYAEDRGEGMKLYQFPVVFPVDIVLNVLPHGLKTYTRSELKYWSEYMPDGTRMCMMRAPMERDEKSKRFIKPFGGRKQIARAENGGVCVPEQCREYQSGDCKLRGDLIFYIPGVEGAGAIALPTTSYYGMENMRQQMMAMLHVRQRISGTFNGKPMFTITKQTEEVSMLDQETGKPKKVNQHIPKLEIDIDMSSFLSHPEEEYDSIEAVVHESLEHDDDGDDNVIDAMPHEYADAEDLTEAPESPTEDNIKEIKSQIWTHLKAMDIDWPTYEAFANEMFTDGWKENIDELARMLVELESVVNPVEFKQQVINKEPF